MFIKRGVIPVTTHDNNFPFDNNLLFYDNMWFKVAFDVIELALGGIFFLKIPCRKALVIRRFIIIIIIFISESKFAYTLVLMFSYKYFE